MSFKHVLYPSIQIYENKTFTSGTPTKQIGLNVGLKVAFCIFELKKENVTLKIHAWNH